MLMTTLLPPPPGPKTIKWGCALLWSAVFEAYARALAADQQMLFATWLVYTLEVQGEHQGWGNVLVEAQSPLDTHWSFETIWAAYSTFYDAWVVEWSTAQPEFIGLPPLLPIHRMPELTGESSQTPFSRYCLLDDMQIVDLLACPTWLGCALECHQKVIRQWRCIGRDSFGNPAPVRQCATPVAPIRIVIVPPTASPRPGPVDADVPFPADPDVSSPSLSPLITPTLLDSATLPSFELSGASIIVHGESHASIITDRPGSDSMSLPSGGIAGETPLEEVMAVEQPAFTDDELFRECTGSSRLIGRVSRL